MMDLDDNCYQTPTDCGCEKPLPDWWKSAKHCHLVADPDIKEAFTGTFYAQVRECDNPKTTTVIDVDDKWLVDIHIEVSGRLTNIWCGHWCISACLESMCGGKTYRFPRDLNDDPPGYCCSLVDIDQGTYDYEIAICVPAGKVKQDECGSLYELTVIVTALGEKQYKKGDPCDPGTYHPFGIAGACEVAHLMFYEGV